MSSSRGFRSAHLIRSSGFPVTARPRPTASRQTAPSSFRGRFLHQAMSLAARLSGAPSRARAATIAMFSSSARSLSRHPRAHAVAVGGSPVGRRRRPGVLHHLASGVVDLGRPVVARLGDVGGDLLLDAEQVAFDGPRQVVAAVRGLLDAGLARFEQFAVLRRQRAFVDPSVLGGRTDARVAALDPDARFGVAHSLRVVRPGPLAAADDLELVGLPVDDCRHGCSRGRRSLAPGAARDPVYAYLMDSRGSTSCGTRAAPRRASCAGAHRRGSGPRPCAGTASARPPAHGALRSAGRCRRSRPPRVRARRRSAARATAAPGRSRRRLRSASRTGFDSTALLPLSPPAANTVSWTRSFSPWMRSSTIP